MKKKLFVLFPALILAACSKGAPVSTYSYTNPEEPQGDYGPVVEANVTLDGFGNESFYDNENVYRINNAAGEDSYAEVKFGFANHGFLAHFYVHETEIFENPNQYIYTQDSVELYINPGLYTDELRSNCVQFRLSPHQRTETWIGMHSPVDDYTWTFYDVPFRYGTHIDGKVITNQIEDFDDSFHHSQGVGYEFYIPYASLGLDYNPQGLDVLPTMITAHAYNSDMQDRVWSPYNGVGIDDLKNYIKVGNRVLKPQGNNIFDTDRTSSGFILDHQLDQTYPYVKNFGYHDQYAYFNACGTIYYAKARITLYNPLQNDQYPKIGMGSINSSGTTVMLLDPRPNKDNFQALVVNRVANQDWQWSSAPISWKGEETYAKPILFEMARYEDTLYFYMNEDLIFTRGTDTLGGANVNSFPMLMTMNYSALFDQCSITTNEEEVIARIGTIDPYMSASLSTGGFVYDKTTQSYSQTGGADQFAVFKKQGTSYTMSVDIRVGDRLNSDNYPKIGIGEYGANKLNCYLFDPRPGKDCFDFIHITGNTTGDRGWTWPGNPITWIGEKTYDRVINLKLVREGSVSKIYMDGSLAYTCNDNLYGESMSHPMFMTMNHGGTFSNISITVQE